MTLLSLLGDPELRRGRRDFYTWCPSLSMGFSCRSFFHYLVDPSPSKESIFSILWSVKVLKKGEVLCLGG